jgi:DNA-binding YbaB/EbfC family protein
VSDTPDTPDTPGSSETPGAPDEPGASGLPQEPAPDELTGGLAGMGGLGGLLESAQQAISAQAQAAHQEVEGSAGGGVVTVTMTGAGEVTAVTLAAEVVDPDDIEMLQDLIVAALHDAGLKVTELQRGALGALGGFDLGGLGDVLGGLPGSGASEDPPAGGSEARDDPPTRGGSGPG